MLDDVFDTVCPVSQCSLGPRVHAMQAMGEEMIASAKSSNN
jgi:hypothetical protein